MRRALTLTALVGTFVLAAATRVAPPPGLALELFSEKRTYAPYEPVVLGYALVNRGTSSRTVSGLVGTQADAVTFEVTDATGEFHRFRTGPIASGIAEDRMLGPGESVRGQVIMISNQFAALGSVDRPSTTPPYPFERPGTYSVRATHMIVTDKDRDERTPLRSVPAQITVRQATNLEQESLRFLGSPAELVLAMGGERVGTAAAGPTDLDLGRAVDRWEDFIDQFADTVYAPFVRLTLASYYAIDGLLPSPRPDLAAAHLRAVIRSGPRSIRDDALLQLAKAELADGRTRQAAAAANELLRSHPQSEKAAEARRISDGLKAGRHTLREIFGQ